MDAYYNPEMLELTVVGSLNDPNACWSFDDLVVWKHNDGRVFWARDSGCSCPSPFEDYNTLESLTEVTNDNWNEFEKAVKDHCYWDGGGEDIQAVEKTQLLQKVAMLL